jgi:hypothetical protein
VFSLAVEDHWLNLSSSIRVQVQANGDGIRVRRLLGLNHDIALSRLCREPPARHEECSLLFVFEHDPICALKAVDGVTRHVINGLRTLAACEMLPQRRQNRGRILLIRRSKPSRRSHCRTGVRFNVGRRFSGTTACSK